MKSITEFSGTVLREAARLKPAEEGAGEEWAAPLGVSGDRLARLTEALAAAGDKVAEVHRVRVMQAGEGEAAPAQAKKQGDFYYLVEVMPSAAAGGGRDRRDRDRDRGGRPGGRGPGGPGGG